MVLREKAGMLSRSTAEYAANFASDEVVEVRTKAEGYAAKVAFKGRDGRTLEALVEDDCYIGWTERPAP
jgi:hypothetical protein